MADNTRPKLWRLLFNGEDRELNSGIVPLHYGTCNSSSATIAKTLYLDNFELREGVRVAVRFANDNTADDVTLNVNGTGAFPVTSLGEAVASSVLSSITVFDLLFTGDAWELVSGGGVGSGSAEMVSGHRDVEAEIPEGSSVNCGGIGYLPGTDSLLVYFDGLKLVRGVNYAENEADNGMYASSISIMFDAREDGVFDFVAVGGKVLEVTDDVAVLMYTVSPTSTSMLPYCPIRPADMGSGTSMTVDWGDGTTSELSAGTDESVPQHEYSASRTSYQVTISGTPAAWLELSGLRFGGAVTGDRRVTHLVSVDSPIPHTHLSDWTALFKYCDELASVPERLFCYNTQATCMDELFYGCESLADFVLNLRGTDGVESANNFVYNTASGTKIIGCNEPSATYTTFYGLGSDVVLEPIEAASVVHPGTVSMYMGTSIPDGWLLCNGSAVSRGIYSDLFTAIGELYGAGDGSTTFNLPDFRDRFPEGAGTNSLGVDIDQGLPQLYSSFYIGTAADESTTFVTNGTLRTGGAMEVEMRTSQSLGLEANSSYSTRPRAVLFYANNYNSIYNNSSNVQPNALAVNYIIKA